MLEIARRLIEEIREDRVVNVAAGVAFFGVLSLFPALLALISVYGLVADPADVERQLSAVSGVLPGPAQDVLQSRMDALVSGPRSQLSWGLVFGVAVALWSASSGGRALIDALNVAFDREETRGFVAQQALGLLMALGLIVFGLVAIVTVTFLPSVLSWVGLDAARGIVSLVRWPLLALAAYLGIAALYRWAPNRRNPDPNRRINAGAALATALWLAVSLALSLYVSRFGNYDATYGAFAGVVALMLWLWLSALSILVGAELDAELERRPARAEREPGWSGSPVTSR